MSATLDAGKFQEYFDNAPLMVLLASFWSASIAYLLLITGCAWQKISCGDFLHCRARARLSWGCHPHCRSDSPVRSTWRHSLIFDRTRSMSIKARLWLLILILELFALRKLTKLVVGLNLRSLLLHQQVEISRLCLCIPRCLPGWFQWLSLLVFRSLDEYINSLMINTGQADSILQLHVNFRSFYCD